MMKKREILVEGLKNNLVKVVFTKVNGDERTMNCTLHDSVLPEPTITETKKKVNKIPQTLSESVNSKKPKNNSEPCPLDVNKSWSNYKTGDDKESGEILPEGFNL